MSIEGKARSEMRARPGRVIAASFALAVVAALLAGVPAQGKPVLANVGVSAIQPAVENPDLCATTGTVEMSDGVDVNIWGFSLDGGDGCNEYDEPQLPGPVIEATVGDPVTINLTNADVPEDVSIVVPGTSLVNTDGVAAGDSTSYTFEATDPGTYLYESDVSDRRGALMGLYGALIVRPTTAGQAYDTAASAYDEEAILVLSEIDPNFSNDPDPLGFDLVEYHPTYWLINGKAYPDTDSIPVDSGDRLLLRYVNAGALHHTPALLGADQRVIARDAYPVPFPHDVISETVASGQTTDAIAVPCDSDVHLFSSNMHLTNGSLSSSPHEPGGMQTVIEVSGSGGCPAAGNIAPTVDAGPDQTVTPTALPATVPATVVLDGTVDDDFVTWGSTSWTRDSGPGTATFANAGDVDTTVELDTAGVHVFKLTVYDGVNLAVYDTVTITLNAPVLLYFSAEGATDIPEVTGEDDADIYAWHGGSSYSKVFDATDNGLGGGADVDAVVVADEDTFYLSFAANAGTAVPTVGTAQDEDVVLYDDGDWSLVFDGSDVGLGDGNAEDVDAFEILGSGVVVVSTEGNPDVGLPGTERDEDLLQCTGTFGDATSCTWKYYVDGSDVELTAPGEDVDGATVLAGAVALTTEGDFAVTGASGADEDMFVCASLSPGRTTSCTGGWSVFFDGSARGLDGNEDLDAIDRP